jgi:competence protein ComEC
MAATLVLFIISGVMLPDTTISDSKDVKNNSLQTEKVTAEKKEESKKEVSASKSISLNGELQVHFVDVGQGAAQVIVTPNKKVMVIDGGNNDEDTMVAYLKQLGVSKIDILVGTHPDADHIGGIDAVIDSFDIGKIYMPKVERNTQTFESVLRAIQKKGLKVTTAKAGLSLNLDPTVETKMISPIDDSDTEANEMSAVVRLLYGDQSFLLTGDAGIPTEEKWIRSGVNLKSTVLLIGHHGSNHSTSEAFVKAVKPKYAVIQVGKNNYGHPTSEVLNHLARNKVSIYRTDIDGTIVFRTDGKHMSVNKKPWVYKPKSSPQTKVQQPNIVITPSAAKPATVPKTTSSIQATATIDNAKPNQNEEVTVTVTVKDQNGTPVSGANVHLNLQYKSKDTVYEGMTNANGVASLSFRIGRAAAGFTVNGDITVSYNGMTITTQTAFTPQ